jgi:hypothetical protein
MKYGPHVATALTDAFVSMFKPGCKLQIFSETGSLLAETTVGSKPAPQRKGDFVIMPFFDPPEVRAKCDGKPARAVLYALDGSVIAEGDAEDFKAGRFVAFDDLDVEFNGRVQFGQLIVRVPTF